MSAPTKADNPVAPVACFAETPAGSGRLLLDPLVRVNRVVQSVGGNSDADVTFLTQEVPSAEGGDPVYEELTPDEIARLYGPTVRCAIGLLKGSARSTIKWLAHGYLGKRGTSLGAESNRVFWTDSATLEPISSRELRRAESQIQGRHMLNKAAAEALAASDDDGQTEEPLTISDLFPADANPYRDQWARMTKHVQALPCIFNPGGRPNRFRRPADMPDGQGGIGIVGPIHFFTYDGDPQAKHWTLWQALWYLVGAYLRTGPDVHLGWGNLFRSDDDDRSTWWELAEADLYTTGEPVRTGLKSAMVRNCHSLACEGFSLLKALLQFQNVAGLYFHEVHENTSGSDRARIETGMHFWCPGDKDEAALAMVRDGSHAHRSNPKWSRPMYDITRHHNVSSAQIQIDHGNTLSRVRVIGDRKYMTITTQLVPGWKPDDTWDDVDPENLELFRGDAYDPAATFQSRKVATEEYNCTFYTRYHRKSDEHYNFSLVGRLWLIDPAGELGADEYNRATGPWTDYEPWTFESLIVEYEEGWTLGTDYYAGVPRDQVRRRRRFVEVAATDDTGKSRGIIVDLSFDAGATWHPLRASAVKVLREQTAIYIGQDDLLGIGEEILDADGNGEPDGDVANFYDAYLQHKLRLRVTADIDLDERITGEATTALSPLAAHDVTQLVLQQDNFGYRNTTADPNNTLKEAGGDVDDSDRINRVAEAMLSERAGADVRGNPIIPWIEEELYPIGTPITGIRRTRNLYERPEISFGGSVARDALSPCVVAKAFRFQNEQSTELTLKDFGLRKALSPP